VGPKTQISSPHLHDAIGGDTVVVRQCNECIDTQAATLAQKCRGEHRHTRLRRQKTGAGFSAVERWIWAKWQTLLSKSVLSASVSLDALSTKSQNVWCAGHNFHWNALDNIHVWQPA